MPRPSVNLAAGRRYLGAREAVRLSEDQTEGLCRVLRANEITIEIARLVAALHTNQRQAERHMVSANERLTAAAYEAPASMLALAA